MNFKVCALTDPCHSSIRKLSGRPLVPGMVWNFLSNSDTEHRKRPLRPTTSPRLSRTRPTKPRLVQGARTANQTRSIVTWRPGIARREKQSLVGQPRSLHGVAWRHDGNNVPHRDRLTFDKVSLNEGRTTRGPQIEAAAENNDCDNIEH